MEKKSMIINKILSKSTKKSRTRKHNKLKLLIQEKQNFEIFQIIKIIFNQINKFKNINF
jgi:hypothetical protein